MKNLLSILFACSFFSCFAETVLEVGLPSDPKPSQIQLAPLHFKFTMSSSYDISSSYAKKIEELFYFDLNNSGIATISKKQNPSSFQVKVNLHANVLKISLFDPIRQKAIHLKDCHVTGNFSQDRLLLHKTANAILKKLFNAEGIATTKILYSTKKANEISEIWVCDYDGHNAKRISSDSSYNVNPCYIPIQSYDGYQNFLYVSYRLGQSKIYAASFRRPMGSPLLSLRGNQLLPSISRKRNKVAFVSDITGRPDLFVQNFDLLGKPVGKPIQLFSCPRATQASSSFSPDGDQIAFVSDKDGPPRIYILDIPGNSSARIKEPILITKKNRQNTSPAWSPDGKKLAYSAKVNGIRQIWIYDFETKQEWQLTDGSTHKENPSWAPNSLHLVCNSENNNKSELYIINLNQKKLVCITNKEGQMRFPCWEPKKS